MVNRVFVSLILNLVVHKVYISIIWNLMVDRVFISDFQISRWSAGFSIHFLKS